MQDYPSPIPNGSGFRYSQSGYTRQEVGGCGFWNADANWANEHALPTIDESVFHAGEKGGLTNIKYMQLSSAFNGRRLCDELQEDLHPNYWAQLALRNCLTQAYNSGTPKGGTCTISATGLNSAGEPNMSLK